MEIGGKKFELSSVIKRAKEDISKVIKDFDDDRWVFDKQTLDEDELSQRMETYVWKYLLHALTVPSCKPVSTEEAVAEVIRQGLKKGDVSFRKNSFRLMLPNRRYIVNKSPSPFSAAPYMKGRKCPVYPCQVNGLSAEAFATLVFYYDSVVPEIESSTAICIEELRRIKLRKKQEEIAKEMTRKTVESLIQEYINPLGLGCHYTISEGHVRIDLKLRKEASFEVSVDQLADRLKDSKAIMDSLKTVEDDIYGSSGPLNILGMKRLGRRRTL